MTQVDYFALATEIIGPYCLELSHPPHDDRFNGGSVSVDVTDGQFFDRENKCGGNLEGLSQIHNEIRAKSNGSDYHAVLTEYNRRPKFAGLPLLPDDPSGPIKIADAFADLPFEDLGEGLPDPAQELLEQNGIRLKNYNPGQHSTTCPECSKAHLSVKIDDKGATWYCHHCGWKGPGRKTPGPASDPDIPGIPFLITQAMKAALRTRGYNDEEIAQLTPKQAHEILAKPDSREGREFVATIVGQAQAATKHIVEEGKHPGLLQMILVHPADEKVSGIYRYELSDAKLIEKLTKDAVNASVAGHNVYIEGRTVRRGLGAKERGKLEDTVAVFALVVDSDADKGKAWTPTVPVSLTVNTSPDNHHYWLFFETALDPATAQKLGERLRKATGGDTDTGNVCQPYRIAGTTNYPNKTKLERGRVITPTRTLRLDDTLWTPERFEQDFPAPAESIGGGTSPKEETSTADESSIAPDTLRVIREGVEDDADRSYAFFNVVKVLKEDGWALSGIITLLARYPKGIASKYRGRLQREVERIWAKLGKGPGQGTPSVTDITLLSKADFLAGYVAPDYLLDGVLQRRFIYSLTAVTGHGKTALALLLAQAVGSADPNARFGPHAVEKGKVVYFVGENPDDVRCRTIGADSKRSDDPTQDRIHYIPGVFDIAELREKLVGKINEIGGADFVIVDTSAAYFLKDDENSNPQMGEHARLLRSLTKLPGNPCVLVLCHPIKHVTDPSQLLPRGGGAFIAEMDGNLTAWKHDDLVTLHHSPDKFRGPGFEPITFRLEKITTTNLVDSKQRLIPTVHAVAISGQEEEEQEASAERDEDLLLAQVNGKRSVADLARACGWILPSGDPHKSKVDRVIRRLQHDRLVKPVRGRHWQLTDEGKKLLKQDDEEDEVADRGGAVGSKKSFLALRGMKQRPTVPCAYCGQTGDVYQFADARLPKGKRHHSALHEGCAEPFFTGRPKPQNNGSGNSDPLAE